ncbi:MAG: glucosaminidase domain-containing protein [Actinomycetales bacterium]|nr:glucosaminidase domain-containing protein [Actinomycetales bacterium]
MDIFGPPTASYEDVKARATAIGATTLFLSEMMPAAWVAAVAHGINPVVQVAQMAHETGWGAYGGAVPSWFRNPCGLKIRNTSALEGATGDLPLAHMQFGSWEAGCMAHSQHLLGYGQKQQNPGEPILSARLVWLEGKTPVTQVEGLGGRWAPSPLYGDKVASVVRRLEGRA